MPIRRAAHHGPPVALWLLVGAWISLLIVTISSIVVLRHATPAAARPSSGIGASAPLAPQAIVAPVPLPSLFGTVVSIDADKVITVTSKQPYTSIAAATATKV